MAAKREEYVRRERGDKRSTSGERPLVQPSGAARSDGERVGARRTEGGRPISDSVPSGSILDRLGYVPTGEEELRSRPGRRRRAAATALGSDEHGAEVGSELSTSGDTWSSALGPPSVPPSMAGSSIAAPSEDATTPPPQTLRDHLAQSGGFYSRVVPSVESVSIPRPPRLPDLDPMAASDAPPPGSDTPPQGARGTTSPRVPRPEAVLIPPLLRRQAEEWKQSGSLSLPRTVSSRHARALQRALLLSMLQSNDFSLLPEGIAQRAAWMFREGWGEGKKQRDADDLCFVLGLSSGPSARGAVIAAANAHIPAESVLPPSSARWSSQPPRPER